MEAQIKLGNIVSRGNIKFVVVGADKNTFTSKPAYGMLDIDTLDFMELNVSSTSLTDICKRARLTKLADDLEHLNELESRAGKR